MPGKRRANDTPEREGQFVQPVKPSTSPTNRTRRDSRPKHAADEPAAPRPRKAAKKAAPRSAPPAAPASAPAGPRPARMGVPGSGARRQARVRRAGEAASDYANRAAYRAAHSKPSVTGRALGGAAAGASAGAAVGGLPGAAVGGGLGAIGGGIGGARAKKAYRAAMRTNGRVRRLLVVEFMICLIIVGLTPMTAAGRDQQPGTWMRRMTAVLGVFFVLGLISAAGAGGAALAAGLGGLITVTVAVSKRDVFTAIAAAVGASSPTDTTGPDIGKVGQVGDKTNRTVTGPGADISSEQVGT